MPDEIDTVDKIMKQIKGREDELIEALWTIQERRIAQRATTFIHKSTKREARKLTLDINNNNLWFPPRPPNVSATQKTAVITLLLRQLYLLLLPYGWL